jgi:TAG lipase/steryl ester hydrolase/phospholipase A2/LPA acyltransferase
VVESLDLISSSDLPDFDHQRKRAFFHEIKHAFGRSALLLSGGASLGMYHLGCVKALFEAGAMPHIITGSSAGAIVAALVCCTQVLEWLFVVVCLFVCCGAIF